MCHYQATVSLMMEHSQLSENRIQLNWLLNTEEPTTYYLRRGRHFLNWGANSTKPVSSFKHLLFRERKYGGVLVVQNAPDRTGNYIWYSHARWNFIHEFVFTLSFIFEALPIRRKELLTMFLNYSFQSLPWNRRWTRPILAEFTESSEEIYGSWVQTQWCNSTR